MKQKPIERGAASFTCELSDGVITIKHGTAGNVLRVLENAPEGTWHAIFECFDSLGIKDPRS